MTAQDAPVTDGRKLPVTEQPLPHKAPKPPKPRKVERRRRGRKG